VRRIVAQTHGKQTRKFSQFNLPPAEFATAAMKRFEEFAKAQSEQFNNFQETMA
jgi:hypothetical protein